MTHEHALKHADVPDLIPQRQNAVRQLAYPRSTIRAGIAHGPLVPPEPYVRATSVRAVSFPSSSAPDHRRESID
jgi:hypothetical protein